MLYRELKRVEKLKKILESIAYASLALDFMIAIVTFISLHVYSKEVLSLLFYLNLSLAVEVAITAFVFLTLLVVSHYEKIIDRIAELSFRIRYGKK